MFTNTLNYTKTFGDHTINALLGMESLRNRYEYFTASRDGFPSDDPNFHFLDAGDVGTQKNSGSATEYSMVSYFGKIDYNYHDRYLSLSLCVGMVLPVWGIISGVTSRPLRWDGVSVMSHSLMWRLSIT